MCEYALSVDGHGLGSGILQDRGFLSKKQPLPPATGLIVHIHGGGFVAQSPKSHEVSVHKVLSTYMQWPIE